MVGIFATPLRRGSVLALAIFLGACGMEPVESSTQSSLSEDNSQALSKAQTRLAEEESRLLSDPLCFTADEEYKPMIAAILDRHNKALLEKSNLPSRNYLKAGYPDYPGGISLRVCDDQNVYAYSYSKTVILHSGLLQTLKEEAEDEELFASAVAFVIYHELGHIQMGHTERATSFNDINGKTNLFPEIEADMFAATVLQMGGYSLAGVDLVFSVLHRINPAGSAAHPPSWERLERVRQLTGSKEANEG